MDRSIDGSINDDDANDAVTTTAPKKNEAKMARTRFKMLQKHSKTGRK